MTEENPEIGQSVDVNGITTNYHRMGSGEPVFLIHGSGPGVSAWANWRLILPTLAESFDVIAPDIVGFGFTDRPEGYEYNMENWRTHLLGFADALGLEKIFARGQLLRRWPCDLDGRSSARAHRQADPDGCGRDLVPADRWTRRGVGL